MRCSAYEIALLQYLKALDLLNTVDANSDIQAVRAKIGLGQVLEFTGSHAQASRFLEEALMHLVYTGKGALPDIALAKLRMRPH
jgi:hypothetical protein